MGGFYSVGIFFYGLAIRTAALWNPKAKAWVAGRKGVLDRIERALASTGPTIWMHCPSLGEFEQGRPLLEELRKQYPQKPIVLTFFSPSGYENQKNYAGADHIFYLPEDTRQNATRFVKAINPELAIFVKYDFWLNYLKTLRSSGVKALLVSGIFRENQHFFGSFPALGREMLRCFDHFFVQDSASENLLAQAGFQNVTVSGDTRFDRVISLAGKHEPLALIPDFAADKFTIVAGSTWPADEALLYPLIHQPELDIQWIIAPHELAEKHLQQIESKLQVPHIRYSQAEQEDLSDFKVLIIDNIGLLSRIYQYAHISYIGGGFGKSIHNILEAAVWGSPVIFGPRHEKFKEAHALLKLGGACTVKDFKSLESIVKTWCNDESQREWAGQSARKYILSEAGATKKITRWIQEQLG